MERLGPHHVVTVAEGCLVFVAGRPLTLDTLKRIEAAIHAASRRQATPLGYLHVILGGSGANKVDQGTIVGFAEMIRRSGRLIGAAAVVVGHQGFLGGAVRAAVSGLFLTARPSYPTKVVSSVGEAASWLATTLTVSGGVVPDARVIAAAVEALATEVRPGEKRAEVR